jgi:hypothetical protein
MTAKLRIAEGCEWTAADWAFDAVLERVLERLTAGAALEQRLHELRRQGRTIDLVGDLTPESLGQLLEATHAAYVRLVRVWRAGFPDSGHDELVEHLGRLMRLLERQLDVPVETWSIRRLQAFGGSIDVCFPKELQQGLLPLIQHDAPLAEQVLRKLRDLDLDEEASAIMGAAFLPAARDEAFLLESASHRREEVRFTLFRLLARNRHLPDPGSLKPNLPAEVTDAILRAGVTDASPRVRQRAVAYAYGLGRVASVKPQLVSALNVPDPDPPSRAYMLLAFGVLDDAETLALLVRGLESGTPEEMNAAVWALARRPDGVARALAAVEDPRPALRPEAIGAIMHVSAPLTDEQLAWLASTDRAPEARAAVEAYRRRKGLASSMFQVELKSGRS